MGFNSFFYLLINFTHYYRNVISHKHNACFINNLKRTLSYSQNWIFILFHTRSLEKIIIRYSKSIKCRIIFVVFRRLHKYITTNLNELLYFKFSFPMPEKNKSFVNIIDMVLMVEVNKKVY